MVILQRAEGVGGEIGKQNFLLKSKKIQLVIG